MPLKVKHYRELARNCRNLADLAHDDEARAAMIAMAEDYERKAELRERSLAAVHAIAPEPVVPPEAILRSAGGEAA